MVGGGRGVGNWDAAQLNPGLEWSHHRLWHQNVLGLNSGFAFTIGMAKINHVTAKSFCFTIYKKVIVRSNREGKWVEQP